MAHYKRTQKRGAHAPETERMDRMNEKYMISLKAARVNAGLSQDDAAKALGVSNATICSWEREKSYPDVMQFERLCNIYSAPTDQIFLRRKYT